MDLAELQQRTLRRLDESTGAPAGVSLPDVTAALNEGLRLFAAISLVVERTAPLPLSANQVWYSASALLEDWFVPLRCAQRPNWIGRSTWDRPLFDDVLFDEEGAAPAAPRRVPPARLAELDALDPDWQLARGVLVARYGVVGFDQLFVYPAPPSENELHLTYAATPRLLIDASDIPDTPEPWHQYLIDFAEATLPVNDGGVELARSVPKLSRFLDAAQRCADAVRSRTRTLQYDREPFELRAFDRSRLIQAEIEKKQQRKRAA